MRPISLYSFFETLVFIGLLVILAVASGFVAGAVSGLQDSAMGLFAAVALWTPVVAAFVVSLVYLRCLRLQVMAYIALEGHGAAEAFSVFKEPSLRLFDCKLYCCKSVAFELAR